MNSLFTQISQITQKLLVRKHFTTLRREGTKILNRLGHKASTNKNLILYSMLIYGTLRERFHTSKTLKSINYIV